MTGLDPHQRPPEDLREVFKTFQRLPAEELTHVETILDPSGGSNDAEKHDFKLTATIKKPQFDLHCTPDTAHIGGEGSQSAPVFESCRVPGLHFIPGLLPSNTQMDLLSRLLHRDLADSRHLTNLHKHYRLPYGVLQPDGFNEANSNGELCRKSFIPKRSFFSCSPETSTLIEPLDPTVHKPLTMDQFLRKKLRWVTLGGQYDWTSKRYPDEIPPVFPEDVGDLVRQAFPAMHPEAAIVNVYSPGDTLSMHRDVSEASSQGLASISLGCEAIFLAGLENEGGVKSRYAAIRLRSGDAVYMSGASRYAWHGVPRILPDSCPLWMRAWPAAPISPSTADPHGPSFDTPIVFESWINWMASKRVNLNVRQMFD